MNIFLIRHGLREDMLHPDWKSTAPRPDDTPLSEEGFRQAGDVAGVLASAGVVALYSSPFLRAVQTAAATSNRLHIPIRIEPGFSEFINPQWFQNVPELMSPAELEAVCPLIDSQYQPVCRDLGFEESEAVTVRHRVNQTLNHILAGQPETSIAIFTHGAPLCQAVSLLIDTLEGIDTGMAAITQVHYADGQCQLVASGSNHLRDQDRIRRFH